MLTADSLLVILLQSSGHKDQGMFILQFALMTTHWIGNYYS